MDAETMQGVEREKGERIDKERRQKDNNSM